MGWSCCHAGSGLAFMIIWPPGSTFPISHHSDGRHRPLGRGATHKYVGVPVGSPSREPPAPPFSWSPRELGAISQPIPHKAQALLGLCFLSLSTLFLSALSTHWSSGPARAHLQAFVPLHLPPRGSLLRTGLSDSVTHLKWVEQE